jgi:hypothetical protein
LRKDPVEAEREVQKLECRLIVAERRVETVFPQPLANGGHLLLRVWQREHRAEPSDVHRVEVAGNDLWALTPIERLKERLELRDPIPAVDARIQMNVHQADRTGGRGDSRCEPNPAARLEAQVMALQRVGPNILQRIAAQDREALGIPIAKAIGWGIRNVITQAVTERRNKDRPIAGPLADLLEQENIESSIPGKARERVPDARVSGHVHAGDRQAVLCTVFDFYGGRLFCNRHRQAGIGRRNAPDNCEHA